MNKKEMFESGAGPYEILQAELDAALTIIETLPVDAHDMDVHFWCSHPTENEDD